jgi:hypothetical protein
MVRSPIRHSTARVGATSASRLSSGETTGGGGSGGGRLAEGWLDAPEATGKGV